MAGDELVERLVTTEHPIGDYLRVLRRRLGPREDAADLVGEVEDHLRETAERLVDGGVVRVQAELQAVARFGDPIVLARLLTAQAPPTGSSRRQHWATGIGLLGAVLWPVTAISYVLQALRDPWAPEAYVGWCGLAAVTLAVSALAITLRSGAALLVLGVLPTAYVIAWQLDVGAGWRWWVTGSVVGLLALGSGRRWRLPSLLVALAWPAAFAVEELGKVLLIGPLDSWGEPILTPLLGYALGAVLMSTGLLGAGWPQLRVWVRLLTARLVVRRPEQPHRTVGTVAA